MILYYILLGIVIVAGFALFFLLFVRLFRFFKSLKMSLPSHPQRARRSFLDSGTFLSSDRLDDDILENGYSKQEYLDAGFSESDIETWGLDEPSAPDPSIAGLVIADMSDGKLDGEFHFPF